MTHPTEDLAHVLEALDLEATLAEGPEPEQTLQRARDVLEATVAADPEALTRTVATHPETLRRVLAACCGTAPFLATRLRARPQLLLALADDDLPRARTAAELSERLAARLAAASADEVPAEIRRFKYDELLRISTREADHELVPLERVGEALGELSDLAEIVLAAALAHVAAELEASTGPPVWCGANDEAVRLRFTVLGLGKLGGKELNYSSDVDLIYVHDSPPPESEPLRDGPGDLSPAEYFSRLAVGFGKLVEANTEDGFLERVDLDLRPEGSQGAIVSSSRALADYYDGWAATWEKAAFMKARPVAGDLAFGWEVARTIDPMIYQSSVDLATVDAIREMKNKIEAAHTGDPERFNVKLGAGGIRDVEFVAQAFQLLHGGRIPQVRGRSAPGALDALAEVGALPPKARDELLAAYRFLRRVENRLQMEAERQTHTLPPPGPARERLARTIFPGTSASAQLDEKIQLHTGKVRKHFEALFRESGSGRVLDLFARAAPRITAVAENRQLIEALAQRFANEIEHSVDPERAMSNLERFVEGVGPRTFYYGLLADRQELIPRLVALFAASRTLSGIVASLPQLMEPLFEDPTRLLLGQYELREELALLRAEEAKRQGQADTETDLAALRLFQQRELVNIGLLDLSDVVDARQVENALSDLAEVCLEEALRIARDQLARTPKAAAWVDKGEFLVVGMGKLGSRELGYGSDLDVIFLYDLPGADPVHLMEAQEAYVRLAQKLGWALQTRTAQGVCYEVDARLRPSGNQGMLVTSLPAFERYHRGETGSDVAAIWERQALLRARPIVGSESLAGRFEALRQTILSAPLPEEAGTEIHRIRSRMQEELARETDGRRNLKTGRGGLLDVESICQWLQLRHGAQHPELLVPRRVEATLAKLTGLGLLPGEHAAILSEGWAFLQRLSSRLRVVENRSIADLEHDRTDLDSVARSLGYAVSERSGTARLPLLDDYTRHTEAIRAVYDRVVRPENG
ncbi:MAG: hypothetical protein GY723_07830 [bacterium]|nr:hypothetical protein [bacterium]MCP5067542.1 hypothetical protein [bacterium]